MPKSKVKNRQKAKSCIKFILFDARLSHETILSTNNIWTIEEEIKNFRSSIIKSTKWCGKSTYTRQIAKPIIYMQELPTREHNIALAKALPKVFLTSLIYCLP